MTLFLFFVVIISGMTSQTSGDYPPRQPHRCPNRTMPGSDHFPSHDNWAQLEASLQGDILYQNSGQYDNESTPHNYRVQAKPYAIVLVQTVGDVQKVVQFAHQYNLLFTVWSSGHSYIGRSTRDGAVVLNLERLKDKTFNLSSPRGPAGEVTVGSGNSWLEVYKAVDQQVTQDGSGNQQRRVIVGGSAHTVGMGGYTQGGGHSPICRTLGMAVDNLIEVTIVLANGSKAVVNEQGVALTDLDGVTVTSDDTSLFWALRGGGGGTWGVVTHFTFKLHFAPERFRNVYAAWALSYWDGSRLQYPGKTVLRKILDVLPTLSSDWGGYLIVNGLPLNSWVFGSIAIFFNHFGNDSSPSNNDITELLNFNTTQNQYERVDRKFDTFLEYEYNAVDPAHTTVYIWDSFIQQDMDTGTKDSLVDYFASQIHPPNDRSSYGCTGTLIGGKMSEVAGGQTPVNPNFRSGLLALTCGLGYDRSEAKSDFYIGPALEMRDRLARLGEGTYFNEPAEDLDDWQTAFWGRGDNYERLLETKRKWDPELFFWCHNCVGSEEAPLCPSSARERKPGPVVALVTCLLLAAWAGLNP